VVARGVGRGNNSRALGQLCKFLGRAFEGEPNSRGDEHQRGEHFAADFEHQIVAPLERFGGVRHFLAEIANPIGIHAILAKFGFRFAKA